MRRSTAALWAAFALGAWQLASVALLGTSPTAAVVTALVGGLVILLVTAWGAVTGAVWAVWLVILLGAVFAVAPFVAGFAHTAGYVASDLVTGVLLILLGVVAAVDSIQRAHSSARLGHVQTGMPAGQADVRSGEDDVLSGADEPVEPGGPGTAGSDVSGERRPAA